MKRNVMIRIDENLVLKAKEYGLNISKVSENALKEMIRRIEGSKTETNGGTSLKNADLSLARGVGFEPTRPLLTTGLAGLPPTRLGQPRNYPLT